jgi:hypothetical protein
MMLMRSVKNQAVFCFLIALSLVAAAGMILPAHGQALQFGYQMHPEKPLENTEAILQIYVMSGQSMVPKQITDLKVTSADSEIVQILGVEQTDQYTTNVRIKTLSEGTANIVVAAPGFSSQEIPISVYTNNNNPTQILLKATPDDFAVDSPKFGYLTVELLTSGGLPSKAINDTKITLLSPNSGVVELKDQELIIPKGEYYAMGQFKVKNPGDAIIFAETQGMKKVSSKIHVREADEPLTLRLYVYPQNYLSLTNNMGYAIVQLEDASGFPVKATQDIKVRITVDNPKATVNPSSYVEEVIFNENTLTIKEGTYSTHTTFTPRPSFADLTDDGSDSEPSSGTITKTFTLGISAEGYSVSGNSITVTHSGSGVGELNGNGPANIGIVPFLTTGEREIIGVAYLETQIEVVVENPDGTQTQEQVTVPVMPTEKFEMKTTSSDLQAVSILNPVFEKGKNAVLIYGNTGTIIPEQASEFTFEDNEGIKKSTLTPRGPLKDDLNMIVQSLVDKILVDDEFPIIAYMKAATEEETGEGTAPSNEEEEEEDSREGPTRFVADAVLTFEADDVVEIEPQSVKKNQPYLIFNAKAKKVGTTTLTGSSGDFDASLDITSETADPTEIQLTHVGTTLSGMNSLATIQLLDSAQNPVFVNEDVEIKLVSDGENIIEIPDSIVIKKGEYFTTFNVRAVRDGQTEISALAENFPLHRFQITVESLLPTLTLTAPDSVLANNDFNADLGMSFGELSLPLTDYAVTWDVQGAEIKRADSALDESGRARILLLASNSESVSITATVTGTGLSSGVATKQITVTQPAPVLIDETSQNAGITGMSVGGIDVLYIIIPAAAGGAIFFLKKTGRLEGILEKIKLDGLIETIKDKIPSRS